MFVDVRSPAFRLSVVSERSGELAFAAEIDVLKRADAKRKLFLPPAGIPKASASASLKTRCCINQLSQNCSLRARSNSFRISEDLH